MSVPANVHFLSVEPLLEEINISYFLGFWHGKGYINKGKIDWVIIGGESGNKLVKFNFRECKVNWISKIVNDCQRFKTPVFVKQLGTHLAIELKLKDRHGGKIEEWPEELQIRQFP